VPIGRDLFFLASALADVDPAQIHDLHMAQSVLLISDTSRRRLSNHLLSASAKSVVANNAVAIPSQSARINQLRDRLLRYSSIVSAPAKVCTFAGMAGLAGSAMLSLVRSLRR
jgi:hypothetical protein